LITIIAVIDLCDAARDGEVRPFRDLGRRPPITLGGRAFHVLMALIAGAVVSKDKLLSRVRQRRERLADTPGFELARPLLAEFADEV